MSLFFEILPGGKKVKKKFFPDALPAPAGSQTQNCSVPNCHLIFEAGFI